MKNANIHIGISGYYYKDAIGRFYPNGIRPSEFILYYQRFFDSVELNFTFYRYPQKHHIKSILKKAPNLRYSIKLHRSFTHFKNYDKKSLEKFVEDIEPIVSSGRFIALLMQFPPSMHYKEESLEHIEDLIKSLKPIPLAIEFRSKSFNRKDVFELLKENNVSIVNVDAPKKEDALVGPWISTANFNYIRIHGRDEENPYKYIYSIDELKKLKTKIRKIEEYKPTYIFFNNTFGAVAFLNALELKKLYGFDVEIPDKLEAIRNQGIWV